MMSSLLARLIFLVGLSVMLLFSLTGVAVCKVFEASLWRELDDATRDRLLTMIQLVEQDATGVEFEWQEDPEPRTPLVAGNEIVTAWLKGEVANVYPQDATPLPKPSDAQRDAYDLILPNGTPARAASVTFQPRIESDDRDSLDFVPATVTVSLARSTVATSKTIARLRQIFACFGLAGLVLTIVSTWLAVNIGLRPVRDVANRIAVLNADTLDQRVNDTDCQPAELRPLLGTINELLDRLRQTFDRERAFSSDVAHELRTPLAGLKAKFDVALSRSRDACAYERTLRECEAITTQTAQIVESLLATTHATQFATASESIEVRELITKLFNDFDSELDSRHLVLEISISPNSVIKSSRSSLQIVLRNLIDNAVSYADENTAIRIDVAETEKHTEILISNHCNNFPVDAINQVFNRFWRWDTSRTSTGRHSGLGLSLAKRITESLGGTIQAEAVNGLFRISCTLPS